MFNYHMSYAKNETQPLKSNMPSSSFYSDAVSSSYYPYSYSNAQNYQKNNLNLQTNILPFSVNHYPNNLLTIEQNCLSVSLQPPPPPPLMSKYQTIHERDLCIKRNSKYDKNWIKSGIPFLEADSSSNEQPPTTSKIYLQQTKSKKSSYLTDNITVKKTKLQNVEEQEFSEYANVHNESINNMQRKIRSRSNSDGSKKRCEISSSILDNDESKDTSENEAEFEYFRLFNPRATKKNYRCRALFNGSIQDHDLPLNCERPQSSENRTFPTSKTFYETEFDEGYFETATGGTLKKASSNGYILANGRTWVSKNCKPAKNRATSPQLPVANSRTSSPISKTRKTFLSNSLRIINGKRIYGGTKECYQFVENGTCTAGIFCTYEHDGSIEHQKKKVCARQLRGMCRNNENCMQGKHENLLNHQCPVCDFYLRMICVDTKCNYLHVKHAGGMEPCAAFNRGICLQGVMCNQPHRYYYSTIKERGLFPNKHNLKFDSAEQPSAIDVQKNADAQSNKFALIKIVTTDDSNKSNDEKLTNEQSDAVGSDETEDIDSGVLKWYT